MYQICVEYLRNFMSQICVEDLRKFVIWSEKAKKMPQKGGNLGVS